VWGVGRTVVVRLGFDLAVVGGHGQARGAVLGRGES
jgi:hypothetical protein